MARKKDGTDEAPHAATKKEKDLLLPSSMTIAELKEGEFFPWLAHPLV